MNEQESVPAFYIIDINQKWANPAHGLIIAEMFFFVWNLKKKILYGAHGIHFTLHALHFFRAAHISTYITHRTIQNLISNAQSTMCNFCHSNVRICEKSQTCRWCLYNTFFARIFRTARHSESLTRACPWVALSLNVPVIIYLHSAFMCDFRYTCQRSATFSENYLNDIFFSLYCCVIFILSVLIILLTVKF